VTFISPIIFKIKLTRTRRRKGFYTKNYLCGPVVCSFRHKVKITRTQIRMTSVVCSFWVTILYPTTFVKASLSKNQGKCIKPLGASGFKLSFRHDLGRNPVSLSLFSKCSPSLNCSIGDIVESQITQASRIKTSGMTHIEMALYY